MNTTAKVLVNSTISEKLCDYLAGEKSNLNLLRAIADYFIPFYSCSPITPEACVLLKMRQLNEKCFELRKVCYYEGMVFYDGKEMREVNSIGKLKHLLEATQI